MFVPDGAAPGYGAPERRGIFDRDTAVSHAAELGAALAPAAVRRRGGGRRQGARRHESTRVAGKQFVDLQNDVCVGDVGLPRRELPIGPNI